MGPEIGLKRGASGAVTPNMQYSFHMASLLSCQRRPSRLDTGNFPHHEHRPISNRLTDVCHVLAVAITEAELILTRMRVLKKSALPVVFALLFGAPLAAEEAVAPSEDILFAPEGTTDLSEFVWKKRPVVVFADSENDPAFIAQMQLLQERPDPLLARDVIVLTDTDPITLSPLRKKLRPRGFMLVILSKEGRIQLRKPFPWDVREISRSIDKLPIRKREIRDNKSTTGG